MFAMAGKMTFDPSVREELVEMLDQLNAQSPTEPGCVAYAFTADLHDRNTFRFFECWEDQATFDAHCATPQYAAFSETFMPKITAVEASRYDISEVTKLA